MFHHKSRFEPTKHKSLFSFVVTCIYWKPPCHVKIRIFMEIYSSCQRVQQYKYQWHARRWCILNSKLSPQVELLRESYRGRTSNLARNIQISLQDSSISMPLLPRLPSRNNIRMTLFHIKATWRDHHLFNCSSTNWTSHATSFAFESCRPRVSCHFLPKGSCSLPSSRK